MLKNFLIIFYIFLQTHLYLYSQTIHQKILVDSFTIPINKEIIFPFYNQNKIYFPVNNEKELFVYDLNSRSLENSTVPQNLSQLSYNIMNDSILVLQNYKRIDLYNLNKHQIMNSFRIKKYALLNMYVAYKNQQNFYIVLEKYKKQNSFLYFLKIDLDNFKLLNKISFYRIFPNYTQIIAACRNFTVLSDSTIIFNHCLFPINFLYKIKENQVFLYHVVTNPNYANEIIRPESHIVYPCLGHLPQAHSNYVFTPIKSVNNYYYQFSYFPTNSEEHLKMITDENVEKRLPGVIQFWDNNFKDLGKIITNSNFLTIEDSILYEYKQTSNGYTFYKYKIIWNFENPTK